MLYRLHFLGYSPLPVALPASSIFQGTVRAIGNSPFPNSLPRKQRKTGQCHRSCDNCGKTLDFGRLRFSVNRRGLANMLFTE